MSNPKLTLTFDNGPTPGVTNVVLDTLADFHVAATFFLVGQDLLKPGRRQIAERAYRDGHRIGNHTMTHSIRLGSSDDPTLLHREIDEAQQVLGDLADGDKLYRPWGDGVLNERLLSAAAVQRLEEGDYTLALWNSVPLDWVNPTTWPAKALSDIASQDWTVLVLHDNESGSMAVLPEFVSAVLERGIEIRRDFPPECTPILRGKRVGSLAGLVASS
jgi:peptidoglycan/xylan/chitin deacetylase (PgdA/CDA1 family)